MEDQDEADFLAKMRQHKKPPFSTPPQYFERVQDEVWKKLQQNTAPKATTAWWQRLFFRPSYALGLLGIAVVIGVSIFLLPTNKTVQTENYTALLSQISDEELYGYVAENEQEFDTDILLENLQESDFAAIPSPSEVFADSNIVPKTTPQDSTSNQPTIPTNNPENLLQGITAEDILNFLEEEGIMDEILDEQKVD